MPGEVKKPLYIGSSLAELNKKIEQNFQKGLSAKRYAQTANKVIAEADKAYKSQDEERAYILFMKYITLWQATRKSKDYKSNQSFIDALLGTNGCKTALGKAEELASSLELRYSEVEAREVSKKIEEARSKVNGASEEVKNDGEDGPVENGVEQEHSVKEKRVLGKDGLVTSIDLYKEIEKNPDTVLVMDIRRSDHYRDSHMTVGQCITIPAEIIKPGITASTLEKGLGEEAKALWRRRTEMEFIVLVDWEGNVKSDSNIAYIKDSMCKWDWGTVLQNEPLVLKGGFEDWLLKYPMFSTNPHAKKPVAKVEEPKNLLDFEYPVFDDEKPPPPPPVQPEPEPEPVQNGTNAQHPRMFFISGAPKPNVDRSLKPGSAPTPTPSGPNQGYVQTDSNRDTPNMAATAGAASGVASTAAAAGRMTAIAGSLSGTNVNKTVATTPTPAPEPVKNSPASTKPPSMPTVNRSLKPKPEADAGVGGSSKVGVTEAADSSSVKGDVSVNTKPVMDATEDSPVRTPIPPEATQEEIKSNAQLEELKKKEEQARQDLDKMRYDRTKAENEKLKQEKAEMEKNLLKLQQEIEANKARQEQRRRAAAAAAATAAAAAPKPTSSTPPAPAPADSTQDKTKSASGDADSDNKAPAPSTVVQSPTTKPDVLASDANKAQHNQNANAATADIKSVAGASATAGSAKPTGLPPGWEKRLDEKSNRYFYLDHNTGTTHWKPPEDGVSSMAKSSSGGSETRTPAASVSAATPKTSGLGEPSSSSRPATASPSKTTRMPLKSESSDSGRGQSSGGLKRSFSSPNIAQMVMNESELSQIKPLPTVDRASKPTERPAQPITKFKPVQQMRMRNLNPVFGSQGRALTGLRNLGNTCFMNSVMQCLSNTTQLSKYFIIDEYMRDINRENPLGRGGEVADEFAIVIKAIWSGQYRSIAPRDLRDTVTKYVPEFRKHIGHHHDSQEFLLFLMDGLHEDLNEVRKREYIKEEDFSKFPDEKAAALSWANHERLNRSIIVALFQGQFKSTVECLSCHNKSVKFEAFMYLSLPIPSNSRCTLQDCLARFSQPEKLSGDNATHCSHCKAHRNSKKTILIWKLPRILLIHLKRFYYEGMWRQKLQTFVDFPLRDLNMANHTRGPAPRGLYQLYAVSNHTGTLDGGHYTACCQNAVNKRWYKYDDHEVYDASQNSIKSSAAYILFYSSIGLTPP